jgi:hypothetical protein
MKTLTPLSRRLLAIVMISSDSVKHTSSSVPLSLERYSMCDTKVAQPASKNMFE